jgi:acetyl esterase/lipase
MSIYSRYRQTASAYWNINRLAVRAGTQVLRRRLRRTPRRSDWSLQYASMVEFMTLGTPKQAPWRAELIREPLDHAAALARLALVTTRPVQTEPWQGEWVAAPGADPDRVILYLHGGGYVSGSPRTHRALMGHLARHARARILALDYRLAPEHVYPAALEDAWAAYWWLLNQGIPPARIAVAGDSAGGGLALALLMALRDAHAPLPAGGIFFSPWVDLALTGASLHKNRLTDYINADILRATAAMYLGGHNPCDPLVSPLYGDLHGLPPLLVQVGSAELLYDDGRRLAHNARKAGVEVQFDVYPGMVHVFQFMYLLEPKSRQAVHAAARFARRQWGDQQGEQHGTASARRFFLPRRGKIGRQGQARRLFHRPAR